MVAAPPPGADIAVASRGPGLRERRLDTIGDEVEGGAAGQGMGARAWCVRTKTGTWWGGFRPTSPPLVIGPGAADRAEHVASHDPRAKVYKPAGGVVVIDVLARGAFRNQRMAKSPCRLRNVWVPRTHLCRPIPRFPWGFQ